MPSNSVTRVLYDGKLLSPAPFLSIEKQFNKSADSTILGSVFDINLRGTLVSYKGSPNSSGTFTSGTILPSDESFGDIDPIGSLMTKAESIRGLFNKANEGKLLQISGCNGLLLSCYPRINTVSLPEDSYVQAVPYQISLEADIVKGSLYPSGEDLYSQFISQASEGWQLEDNETAAGPSGHQQHTYRLTHSISAVGKRHYESGTLDSPAWVQAQLYVQNLLGLDSERVRASGNINIPTGYGAFNHVRTENLDKLGGNYEVTETFLLAPSGCSAIEDFTITAQNSAEQPIISIGVEGTIQGLESIHYTGNAVVTTTKFQNASGAFNGISGQLYTRALVYGETFGRTLNIIPLNYSIGKNPVQGLINYSYNYDSRPSNCFSGVISENISITNNNATDIYAKIIVLGRSRGELLQPINTTTAPSQSIQIDIVAPTTGICLTSTGNIELLFNPPWKAQVQTVVDLFKIRLSGLPASVYTDTDTENYSPRLGQFSRSVSWTYSRCSG